LFDVAFYCNNTRSGVPVQANVSAHFDPGLLAVSWYSNSPGLQVYHRIRQKWIDVPCGEGQGVVWAGQEAALLSKTPTGIHRVIYPDELGKPRITMWNEACIPEQLDPVEGKKGNYYTGMHLVNNWASSYCLVLISFSM
jgi:isopenicillin N synthase-like dioxygenase